MFAEVRFITGVTFTNKLVFANETGARSENENDSINHCAKEISNQPKSRVLCESHDKELKLLAVERTNHFVSFAEISLFVSHQHVWRFTEICERKLFSSFFSET